MSAIFFLCLTITWYASASSIVSNCSQSTVWSVSHGKVYCGPSTVVTITETTNQANITTQTSSSASGSSTCALVCSKGFHANGTTSVPCQANVTDTSQDFAQCQDINECLNSTLTACGSATCFNYAGSFACICQHGTAYNKTTHKCAKYVCPKNSACGTVETNQNISAFLGNGRLTSLNASLINVSAVKGSQMGVSVVYFNTSYATTEIQIVIKKATSGGVVPQTAWYRIGDALADPNSTIEVNFSDLYHYSQLNPPSPYQTHYDALWGIFPLGILVLLCALWPFIMKYLKSHSKGKQQQDFDEESAQPVLEKEPISEPATDK